MKYVEAYDLQRRIRARVDAITHGYTKSAVIVVCTPPQSGKTKGQTSIGVTAAHRAIGLNIPYIIRFALADANNNLRTQTESRVSEAFHNGGFDWAHRGCFQVEHRRGFGKLEPLVASKDAVVVTHVDEAHYDTATAGATDRLLLQEHSGIHIVILWSATPWAHMIRDLQDNSPYDEVIVERADVGFNGLKEMREAGRLMMIQPFLALNRKRVLSTSGKERFSELIQHGGYMLIRVNGKRSPLYADAIKRSGYDVNLVMADSGMGQYKATAEHWDISEIIGDDNTPGKLSQMPNKPTVVLVKQALRCGSTIKPEWSKNICSMIDTDSKYTKSDAVSQSFAGRSCGYGKLDDTYKIYANFKELDYIIRVFDGDTNAAEYLSGLKVNKTASVTKGHWKIVPNILGGRTCSGNDDVDIAKEVLDGNLRWERNAIVYLDKSNPNHKESWNRLKKEWPEAIGERLQYVTDSGTVRGAELSSKFRYR